MALRGVMTGGGDGSATGTPSTVVLTLPAGCVAGDVALACIDGTTGTNTVTTPSDGGTAWTVLSGPDTSGSTQRAYVYGRTLASGDISAGVVTLTWSGGTRTVSAGIVLSGDTLTGVVVGTPLVQASNTSITMPSITTTVANSDVVYIIANRIGAGTPSSMTWPGTYTGDKDAKQASAGVNMEVSIAHLTTPGAAGSYGGNSVSWTGSQGPTVGYTIGVAAGATNGSVTAVAGTVSASAAVPVVSATRSANVAGVAATVSALAAAPTVSAIRNPTVTAVAATVAVAAAAPVVTGIRNATVTAVAATCAVAAAAPTVSAGAGVTAVHASVAVAAPAPVVSAGTNASVIAVAATASVAAVAPAVSATRSANVVALPALGSVNVVAPILSGGATVTAPAAVIAVLAPAPFVYGINPRDIQLSVVLDPPRYKATANTTSRFSALAAGSRFKSIGEEML